MSPLTPKDPAIRLDAAVKVPRQSVIIPNGDTAEPRDAVATLHDPYVEVRNWSPQQVAEWMYDAGFEDSVVEKFRSNDISGAILVDLKFADLKELDIQSFGKRHRLWNEIQRLRGSPISSPVDESPPHSDGSRASSRSPVDDCLSPATEHGNEPTRRTLRKSRRRRVGGETVVSPAESVSIVGIEQLIPKPHKCSKGENCSKYRRQQRQFALLAQEHPISPEHGGQIIITGNPGNASTAESLLRPVSEVVPSVVASSDVLGPDQRPPIRLHEEHLRVIESRDPQENVMQFLNFQHVQSSTPEMPSSPPYEMFPPLQSPARRPSVQDNLRSLPKLSIPLTRSATVSSPTNTVVPASRIDRFGTPCSAMDVPVTAIPLGPIARDFSQSVPPDMRYRRCITPSLVTAGAARTESWHPRFGMARVDEDVQLEEAVVDDEHRAMMMMNIRDVNHAGWMKKRKTKFLRHEWQEHHFTLKGTSLAMRQDPQSSKVLEALDVDDYAIACSSMASNKLSAAFKAMKFTTGKKEFDSSAFAFQLVPAAEKKGMKQAATGKTHHFAVKSRDERIDWMRELMLAKALKQKGEGYQVSINGNMI